MEIRHARPADHPAVLALAPRLTTGVAPWRTADAVGVAVVGWVRASLAADDAEHATFVAEVEGEIAGFVTVHASAHWSGSTDAMIGELVVAESHEGVGIGTALVERAIAWASDAGIERVAVSTGAANDAARRLYASLGFLDEDVMLSRTSADT